MLRLKEFLCSYTIGVIICTIDGNTIYVMITFNTEYTRITLLLFFNKPTGHFCPFRFSLSLCEFIFTKQTNKIDVFVILPENYMKKIMQLIQNFFRDITSNKCNVIRLEYFMLLQFES